jgi:hypothetical protein
VRLSAAFEAPLMFRETNAEAIRTMIFVEQNKVKLPDSIETSIRTGTQLTNGLNLDVKKLDLEINESESEKEVLKRREDIQKKMDEIERLLEDLQ